MKTNFPRSLALVLAHEGGFVDHPADPGGATNQGVTQATYDLWRRSQGAETRSVRQLEPHERDTIYKRRFWDAVRGDDLPAGIDYAVFDAAVNSGPSRGARWLQQALGVPDDGKVGPVTLDAAKRADAAATVRRMCALRLAFMRSLNHWPTFGRGWTRRVESVEAAAVAMTVAASPPKPPPRPLGSGVPRSSVVDAWRAVPWLAAAAVVAFIVYNVATRMF